MCTKCVISFSPQQISRYYFHLCFANDGNEAEADACARQHSVHGRAGLAEQPAGSCLSLLGSTSSGLVGAL